MFATLELLKCVPLLKKCREALSSAYTQQHIMAKAENIDTDSSRLA
jgi:hypothetical protein